MNNVNEVNNNEDNFILKKKRIDAYVNTNMGLSDQTATEGL